MNEEFAIPLIGSPFGSHKGVSSGRPFFPEELELAMQKQETKGVEITAEEITDVSQHLA